LYSHPRETQGRRRRKVGVKYGDKKKKGSEGRERKREGRPRQRAP
jgi:hypothetical protein